MNRGFVKIFRCIDDNVLWRSNEPYCRRAAWIDLIFQVNHEEKEFILGNQKMVVKRGQRWTSISKLAQRWGWSEKKVRAYLDLLKAEGMIYLETTNRGTLITLVNYSKFQDFGIKREGQKEGQKTGQKEGQTPNEGRTEDRAKGRQTRTNKNDIKNELKNEKKPAAQSGFFVED